MKASKLLVSILAGTVFLWLVTSILNSQIRERTVEHEAKAIALITTLDSIDGILGDIRIYDSVNDIWSKYDKLKKTSIPRVQPESLPDLVEHLSLKNLHSTLETGYDSLHQARDSITTALSQITGEIASRELRFDSLSPLYTYRFRLELDSVRTLLRSDLRNTYHNAEQINSNFINFLETANVIISVLMIAIIISAVVFFLVKNK